jgi:hypothetical protein
VQTETATIATAIEGPSSATTGTSKITASAAGMQCKQQQYCLFLKIRSWVVIQFMTTNQHGKFG